VLVTFSSNFSTSISRLEYRAFCSWSSFQNLEALDIVSWWCWMLRTLFRHRISECWIFRNLGSMFLGRIPAGICGGGVTRFGRLINGFLGGKIWRGGSSLFLNKFKGFGMSLRCKALRLMPVSKRLWRLFRGDSRWSNARLFFDAFGFNRRFRRFILDFRFLFVFISFFISFPPRNTRRLRRLDRFGW